MFEEIEMMADEEDFGSIEIRNSVTLQDHLGHFMTQMAENNRNALETALEHGYRVSYAFAPNSTGALRHSLDYRMTGDKTGEISVGTTHWRYANYGARPHPITGRVRFFWEKEDRWWRPGNNDISHPGMQGTHFMQEGYHAAKEELLPAMQREYRAHSVFSRY